MLNVTGRFVSRTRFGMVIAGVVSTQQVSLRPTIALGPEKKPYRRVTKNGTAGAQENHHTSQG